MSQGELLAEASFSLRVRLDHTRKVHRQECDCPERLGHKASLGAERVTQLVNATVHAPPNVVAKARAALGTE